MRALVVYDTKFGNTERVARAIGERLRGAGEVTVAAVSERPQLPDGLNLLVVGSPQAFRMSPPMREWVDATAWWARQRVATFDTRLGRSRWLTGSAARSLARRLRRCGCQLVGEPQSFIVAGSEGPLREGELDRAARWADSLVAPFAAVPAR